MYNILNYLPLNLTRSIKKSCDFHKLINQSVVMAMVDCGGRFCDRCHGQFVKDGSALVFYGGFWDFGQPQSITLIDRD